MLIFTMESEFWSCPGTGICPELFEIFVMLFR